MRPPTITINCFTGIDKLENHSAIERNKSAKISSIGAKVTAIASPTSANANLASFWAVVNLSIGSSVAS